MINLLALSASRSCVEALFRQTSLCNLYFLLLIITSLNTTCSCNEIAEQLFINNNDLLTLSWWYTEKSPDKAIFNRNTNTLFVPYDNDYAYSLLCKNSAMYWQISHVKKDIMKN